MDGVELARHRVGEDQHAALAHERAPLVEVEEVPEPEAHDEHRVQRRVHVVRADVGQPGRDDVRLADDADRLLLGHPLQRHLVDRLGRPRGDARHAVGRELALEELAARLHGHPVGRALDRGERRLVAAAPQRGRLAQEGHRPAVHAVVGRRLDVEHGDDALDDVALGVGPVVQLGVRRVHERARVRHRVRVVVCADRAVRAEADRRGLRAALQRRAHEVHVDEQVGLGGAPVQRDGRAVRALADDDVAVRVLGVVVVQAVGPERGEGALADGVAQLGGGHPAVQRQRGDELDVLDAGAVRALHDLLDDLPADVGRAHRRQRDGRGRRTRWSAASPAAGARRADRARAARSAPRRSVPGTSASEGTGGGALTTREPTGRRSSRSCSPEWKRVGGECSVISVTQASRSSAVRRVVRWMVVGVPPTGRSTRDIRRRSGGRRRS